jgi:hypothetical protein
MYKLSGGCHCGNLRVDLQLTLAPHAYSPRACDCDFCHKHNATYISDPQGSLVIHFSDERLKGAYRQGSAQAEFIYCKNCGVLVCAMYNAGARLFAAVNARAVSGGQPFGPQQSVSPKTLSASEKLKRWQEAWFPHVKWNDRR